MKLLGGAKIKITKDENCENVPHLEITEVVLLIYCNIVNSDYQQDSRVVDAFVPTKSFVTLLDISLKKFIFLETQFSYIEVSFTDQSSKPLEIEDKTKDVKYKI